MCRNKKASVARTVSRNRKQGIPRNIIEFIRNNSHSRPCIYPRTFPSPSRFYKKECVYIYMQLGRRSSDPRPDLAVPCGGHVDDIFELFGVGLLLAAPDVDFGHGDAPGCPEVHFVAEVEHEEDGDGDVCDEEVRDIPVGWLEYVEAIGQGEEDHCDQ